MHKAVRAGRLAPPTLLAKEGPVSAGPFPLSLPSSAHNRNIPAKASGACWSGGREGRWQDTARGNTRTSASLRGLGGALASRIDTWGRVPPWGRACGRSVGLGCAHVPRDPPDEKRTDREHSGGKEEKKESGPRSTPYGPTFRWRVKEVNCPVYPHLPYSLGFNWPSRKQWVTAYPPHSKKK